MSTGRTGTYGGLRKGLGEGVLAAALGSGGSSSKNIMTGSPGKAGRGRGGSGSSARIRGVGGGLSSGGLRSPFPSSAAFGTGGMGSQSVLSLNSMPDGDADASDAMVAAQGRGHAAASWGAFLGLLRGLRMAPLLHAAASGVPGALLDASLPAVPWRPEEETRASPDAGGASFVSVSAAASGRPAVSWPMMRKLGAGVWLCGSPDVLAAKVRLLLLLLPKLLLPLLLPLRLLLCVFRAQTVPGCTYLCGVTKGDASRSRPFLVAREVEWKYSAAALHIRHMLAPQLHPSLSFTTHVR